MDGLRAIDNYEKVLNKVELIMASALQKNKDPEKAPLSRLQKINYKMDKNQLKLQKLLNKVRTIKSLINIDTKTLKN